MQHNIRFRESFVEDHCGSSECLLFCKDLKRFGYHRIFINPNVQVTYSLRFYYWRYFYSTIERFVSYFMAEYQPTNFNAKIKDNKINIPNGDFEWCLPSEMKIFYEQLACLNPENPNRFLRIQQYLDYFEQLREKGLITYDTLQAKQIICDNPSTYVIYDVNMQPPSELFI